MTNWCKHYRGMHEKETCEAGIRFDSLPNHGTKEFHASCPCFSDTGNCPSAAYRTPEEIAKDKEELAIRFAGFIKAREAIVESLGGPWQHGVPAASGRIDCPVCKAEKSLGFIRAGVNGHIHAACKTDGCVRWAE
jgi:hypothetical protein